MSKITIVRTKPVEKTYEQFLEERKQGIGGSDIGHMLDIEPYGCKRRLYLDKLGLLPKQEDSFHFERGKFFEEPVARLYEQKTGRKVRAIGTCFIQEHPEVRCNPDKMAEHEDKSLGYGALEIKVPGEHMFRKMKKEGISESYVAQLNYEMLCAGTRWGAFGIYWADGHELIHFDLDRDEELCRSLFETVKKEWKNISLMIFRKEHGTQVMDLPPKKDVHYKGCEKCPAFSMCHGEEAEREQDAILMPGLEVKAQEYERLTIEEKSVSEARERLKDEFKAILKEANAKQIIAGPWALTVRFQTKESLDTNSIKKLLTEAQIVQYTKQSEFQVFTAKKVKK